ncbi:MAG: NAD(+) diphosphatase [Glaciecola sp.]|jgi:NAD+ diphosphatase
MNTHKFVVLSENKLLVQTCPKQGFVLPDAEYFSSHAICLDYADDTHVIHQTAELTVSLIDMRQQRYDEDDFVAAGLRDILMGSADVDFQILAKAWQYAVFLRTHQFCGQCGAELRQVQWEMARHCDRCQHRVYPRVSPCIIVAIRHENKILLAQGNRHTSTNLYSTLAGFVESGESLEQAVHREVMEEVGVKLKNVTYFDSQPWPFPHSLMMGFVAEYAGGDIVVDGKEILDAQWFTFDALPNIPPQYSIAGRLIAYTKTLVEAGH